MSHMETCQTPYKDKEVLISLLEDTFGKNIEVYDSNKLGVMIGYGNVQSNAEIVIRRNVCQGYGDIGFRRSKNGSFEMVKDNLQSFNAMDLSKRYIERLVARRFVGSFRVSGSSEHHVTLQIIKE